MRLSAKFIVLFLVCLISSMIVDIKGKAYDKLVVFSSDDLFRKAQSYESVSPDTALICYSVIDSRYNKNMNVREKSQCVDALVNKGNIYLYYYFNLAGAYECFSRAEEIAEENAMMVPAINMKLGILYQTFCDPLIDYEASQLALANYRKGLRDAIDVGDMKVADVIVSNLVYISFITNCLDSIKPDWEIYCTHRINHPNAKFSYNKGLYKALSYHEEGHYQECIAIFDSLISYLPKEDEFIRYRLAAYLHQSKAMMDAGDYKRALINLALPLSVVEKESIKDLMMDTYEMLAQCSRHLNNEKEALEYENRGLKLRDSLINYSQLSRLNEIKTGRDLRKVEARIAEIETKRKNQQKILLLTAVFSGIVLVLIAILYSRNKRLRQSNRALYAKNLEIIGQNEKEREMRIEYERRIEDINGRIDDCESEEDDKIANERKYKNSPLDDNHKSELLESVKKVMDSFDEYLHPDFTIDRLSEMVGSKSKLVSQVINEKAGCNFNNFINEYRIREACVRINDVEKYGNLTLDAISKSVGFRARSSFFKAFKSVTGLTPSEFIKIARQKES